MSDVVDMVIPAAPKDYSKLPFVIASVREFINVETIHIIAPDPGNIGHEWPNVILHRDDEVLPYDRSQITYRPNWVFQQLLKMFQDVTQHDWFLVIDADIFPCQYLPLWTETGKPIFYLGRDQAHGPYFGFNEKILGFGKIYPWSFLSECVLYSKSLVREMLAYCNLTLDTFWEKLVAITTVVCCPGDAELYGSYIFHEHPNLYEIRHLTATLGGRYGSCAWTGEEIKTEVERIRRDCPGAHLVSLHSWEGSV